jgi:hypothetical protein
MTIAQVQKTVERHLENDVRKIRPTLVNSDKRLQLAVWKEQGLNLTDEQERVFMDCISAESIARARRLLSEKYPASDPLVFQKRAARQLDHIYAFGAALKPKLLANFRIVARRTVHGRKIMFLERKA